MSQLNRESELAILYEIASISRHLRDRETIQDLTLEKATRLLGAEIAVLYLTATSDTQLHACAARGIRLKKVSSVLVPVSPTLNLGQQLLVWTACHSTPFPVPVLPAEYPVQAALGIPIKRGTSLLGWLYVAILKRAAFDPRVVVLYDVLADQVSSTLETTLAWEQARQQQLMLAEANQRLEQALSAVHEAYVRQEQLLQTIQDLSVPVLPIGDQALLVPLIGYIDSQRAQQIQTTMLAAVGQQHPRCVILDMTGVALLDPTVAQMLLATARSARLLGAQVIVCGVTPRVAEVIIALDSDLTITTVSDLRAAMRLALLRR